MIATESVTANLEVPLLPEYVSLFPLPFAPFERFLLQDERPGYPMTFYVEMVFLGKLNRAALEQAIVQAAARHPLLLAHAERKGRSWQWVLPSQGTIPFDSQDAREPYSPPRGLTIDLAREGGLRVWVREDAERTSLTFQLHHACADGEGSRHFGFDLLTAYSRLTSETPAPEWTRVEYQRLTERAKFQPATLESQPNSTTFWQKIRDGYHFHLLGPTPLAAAPEQIPSAESELEGFSPRPLMLKHLFTREETSRIERQATASGGRLNEVAIALLFQTLAQWQSQAAGKGGNHRAAGKKRLRILMPTDLRERADRWLTATNRVSFSFLSRNLEQCQTWNELLTSVAQETKYIKGIRLGLDFLNALGSIQRIPGLLPLLLHWPRCMATAVLTNLGDTTRRFRSRFPMVNGYPTIGDVRLEQVVGVPPLRPKTHAGFGICFCSGLMAVSLRADPAHLNPAATEQLLQAYISAWRTWAEISEPTLR